MPLPAARLALPLLCSAASAFAVPAFPGAEGFGANAKGARASASPTVYRVTNLNDSGSGSLRDAVSVSGRVVVFDVGGIIRINNPLVFASNLTIAGQTAPGGGVTVYGNRVSFSGASNAICRYIRFRMGIDGDDGADAVGIANGADMVFDHVSASWGRDETFSISGDAAQRITLQDCLIAQGLRIHSAGGLMQTSGGVSIFRSLYADNYMRNPKIKGVNDYINNVVYNWGSGGGYIPAGDSAGDSYCNVINNTFIAGPETGAGRSPFTTGNTNYRIFHSGNLEDLDLDGTLDAVAVGNNRFSTLQVVGTRFAYPAPTTQLAAPAALDWVLANAGASHRRDRTDDYVVNEVRSYGTSGVFIFDEAEMGGIGSVPSGLKRPDSDNDGVPDWWEQAAGTNPAVADSTVLGADGYLNIERYLNALVVGGVPGAFISGISTDTGSSASDGVTSDRTLVLAGTATPGAYVAIARADLGALGTVVADGLGAWTFDYSGVSLADRVYAFTATATVGGVVTPPSPAFVVTIDNIAAPAPAITSLALSPEAALSGTAQPGDLVSVKLSDTIVAATFADELGNWTMPSVGSGLPAGTHTFVATATDLAGNTGPASAPYVVNTGVASPVFTAISTDSGASASDRLTNDTTLTLTGTAPSGATVSITRAGVGVVGSVVASGGVFTFNYTATALPAGVHAFTAVANTGGAASPASAPFVVTIDTAAPAVSSIRRQNPATYSTNGGTVVYRVTFAEPVTGVDLADFGLTKSGTNGTAASLSAVSQTVYDVTVTGVSGDGTLRLNLNSSGTGIADLADNAVSGGYTAGQTYTVRLAGSGVWINTDDDGLWSETANWDGGLVASGSGATADFSLRDLTADTSLVLDGRRTLGRLVFGDTDYSTPAGWTILGGGASPGITLAGSSTPVIEVNAATSQLGDTTDVPAAADYPHHLAVPLGGTAGFTKTGVGTIEFNADNRQLTGALTISKGVVQVGPGGIYTPSSVTIATSQQLRVVGGQFSTSGNVSWTSGTGTGVIVSGGTASFQNIVPSNTRNSFFRVTGGVVTAGTINFPRSGDSEAQTSGTGVLISGGDTTFANIGLGTSDSWGGMTVSGGKLTVTGTLHNGYQKTAGRGGVIYLSGGELTVTSPLGGLVMSRNPGTNTNNVSKLLITGGAANLARLVLGYDSTASAGSATVTLTNGQLNIGSGGIVKNGASGLASSITLNSGTLGALANWSTAHPLNLAASNSAFVIRTATPEGLARDITLTGALTGTGGFTKTGGGTLTLAGAHTVGNSVNVNEGTLLLTGSLSSTATGKQVVVNSGGTFAGTGTLNSFISPALKSGGTLSPGGAAAATWTLTGIRADGGARIRFDLGATSDLISSGLSFTGGGASSTITFDFVPGDLTAGATYPLVNGSISLASANLAYTGLGYATGHFNVSSNAITFTLDDDGQAVAPLYDWLVASGQTAGPAAALADTDHDGQPALLEFALGGSTDGQDAALATIQTTQIADEFYPSIRFLRRKSLGGVILETQVSDSPGFETWRAAVPVSVVSVSTEFEEVVARSPEPMGPSVPRQFLRVRATLP